MKKIVDGSKQRNEVIKDYLKLGRVSASAMLVMLFFYGYFLARGFLVNVDLIVWGLMGLLYHYQGYCLNNILDYKEDLRNPFKRGYSLVEGRISLENARNVFLGSLLFLLIMGFVYFGLLVAILTFIFCLFSFVYNKYSKTSMVAQIFGAVSLTPTPISYFAYAETIPFWFLLLFLSMATLSFTYFFYGHVKDIEFDAHNILRRFRVRIINKRLRFPALLKFVFISLICCHYVTAFAVGFLLDRSLLFIALFFPCLLIETFLWIKLINPKEWIRENYRKYITFASLFGYILLATSTISLTSLYSVVFTIFFVFSFSKILNKTIWDRYSLGGMKC